MSKKGKRADADEQKRREADEASAAAHQRAVQERRILQISRAIADPTRFSILRSIASGSGRCGLLRESLSISAATLSHHLKELEKAGIVVLARDGRFIEATLDRKLWKHYLAALKAVAQ